VQADCHDNRQPRIGRRLVEANARPRAVAFVGAEVTDAELNALDAAGVRGVRSNFNQAAVDFHPQDVSCGSPSGSRSSAGHI